LPQLPLFGLLGSIPRHGRITFLAELNQTASDGFNVTSKLRAAFDCVFRLGKQEVRWVVPLNTDVDYLPVALREQLCGFAASLKELSMQKLPPLTLPSLDPATLLHALGVPAASIFIRFPKVHVFLSMSSPESQTATITLRQEQPAVLTFGPFHLRMADVSGTVSLPTNTAGASATSMSSPPKGTRFNLSGDVVLSCNDKRLSIVKFVAEAPPFEVVLHNFTLSRLEVLPSVLRRLLTILPAFDIHLLPVAKVVELLQSNISFKIDDVSRLVNHGLVLVGKAQINTMKLSLGPLHLDLTPTLLFNPSEAAKRGDLRIGIELIANAQLFDISISCSSSLADVFDETSTLPLKLTASGPLYQRFVNFFSAGVLEAGPQMVHLEGFLQLRLAPDALPVFSLAIQSTGNFKISQLLPLPKALAPIRTVVDLLGIDVMRACLVFCGTDAASLALCQNGLTDFTQQTDHMKRIFSPGEETCALVAKLSAKPFGLKLFDDSLFLLPLTRPDQLQLEIELNTPASFDLWLLKFRHATGYLALTLSPSAISFGVKGNLVFSQILYVPEPGLEVACAAELRATGSPRFVVKASIAPSEPFDIFQKLRTKQLDLLPQFRVHYFDLTLALTATPPFVDAISLICTVSPSIAKHHTHRTFTLMLSVSIPNDSSRAQEPYFALLAEYITLTTILSFFPVVCKFVGRLAWLDSIAGAHKVKVSFSALANPVTLTVGSKNGNNTDLVIEPGFVAECEEFWLLRFNKFCLLRGKNVLIRLNGQRVLVQGELEHDLGVVKIQCSLQCEFGERNYLLLSAQVNVLESHVQIDALVGRFSEIRSVTHPFRVGNMLATLRPVASSIEQACGLLTQVQLNFSLFHADFVLCLSDSASLVRAVVAVGLRQLIRAVFKAVLGSVGSALQCAIPFSLSDLDVLIEATMPGVALCFPYFTFRLTATICGCRLTIAFRTGTVTALVERLWNELKDFILRLLKELLLLLQFAIELIEAVLKAVAEFLDALLKDLLKMDKLPLLQDLLKIFAKLFDIIRNLFKKFNLKIKWPWKKKKPKPRPGPGNGKDGNGKDGKDDKGKANDGKIDDSKPPRQDNDKPGSESKTLSDQAKAAIQHSVPSPMPSADLQEATTAMVSTAIDRLNPSRSQNIFEDMKQRMEEAMTKLPRQLEQTESKAHTHLNPGWCAICNPLRLDDVGAIPPDSLEPQAPLPKPQYTLDCQLEIPQISPLLRLESLSMYVVGEAKRPTLSLPNQTQSTAVGPPQALLSHGSALKPAMMSSFDALASVMLTQREAPASSQRATPAPPSLTMPSTKSHKEVQGNMAPSTNSTAPSALHDRSSADGGRSTVSLQTSTELKKTAPKQKNHNVPDSLVRPLSQCEVAKSVDQSTSTHLPTLPPIAESKQSDQPPTLEPFYSEILTPSSPARAEQRQSRQHEASPLLFRLDGPARHLPAVTPTQQHLSATDDVGGRKDHADAKGKLSTARKQPRRAVVTRETAPEGILDLGVERSFQLLDMDFLTLALLRYKRTQVVQADGSVVYKPSAASRLALLRCLQGQDVVKPTMMKVKIRHLPPSHAIRVPEVTSHEDSKTEHKLYEAKTEDRESPDDAAPSTPVRVLVLTPIDYLDVGYGCRLIIAGYSLSLLYSG